MVNILVADDDDISRDTIAQWVESWGYDVIRCRDGSEAWEVLRHNPPSVAILDWVMPCYSGTDLCRMYTRLDTQHFVYMIVLARRAANEDLFAALDVGAHDYIPIPPNPVFLKSRITAGVRLAMEKEALKEINEALDRYAEHLEKVVAQRAKELVHADRVSTLGVMSAGIAHEINNPLSFIGGNIQTVSKFWKEIEPVVRARLETDGNSESKLQFILKEMPRALESMKNGVSRVSSVIKGLKAYSGEQKTDMGECSLNEVIHQALAICQNSVRKHIVLEKDLSADIPLIVANLREIEQVVVNLVVNAAQALEPKPTGKIKISTRLAGNFAELAVEDDGAGIAPEIVDKIWDPFFTTKEVGKGTGLGLAVSQGIVRNHKGQISVKNVETGGARFLVRLPIVTQQGGQAGVGDE